MIKVKASYYISKVNFGKSLGTKGRGWLPGNQSYGWTVGLPHCNPLAARDCVQSPMTTKISSHAFMMKLFFNIKDKFRKLMG